MSKNAFITSDEGLFKVYKSNGIDTILVTKNGINLPEYDCGFIGGASAVLGDFVCFFGAVSAHPDYEKIADFVSKHGKKIVELSDEILTDIGGCIALW